MQPHVSRHPSAYTLFNRVQLIHGGRPFFDTLEAMIDGAKTSLYFQTYIFSDDYTGNRIANGLMRAAHRGVTVFLLLDGYASQDLRPSFIQKLLSSGIHFRWFGPIWRNRYFYVGRRLHHKIVVVDGHQCLIGGINISDRYNDLPGVPGWLDFAMLADGEAAQTAMVLCARRVFSSWKPWQKKFRLPVSEIVLPEEKCLTRLRVNDWVRGKREISRSYIHMLRTARSEVIIASSYFGPGFEFRRALRLAAKRGVRIRLILAGISDIPLAKHAERYFYAWLFRNKIEVYEYTRNVIHAKIACCDDEWMTVGSFNINDLSAKASIELNMEVMDTAIAKQVRVELTRVMEQDCVQVTTEQEKKTSLFQKFLQRTAYDLFRLLLFMFTFYFRRQKD